MEPTGAARFLNPSRFCLAAAATAPGLGELDSSAFPTLFALIAAECNMPLSDMHPPNMSFSALTRMFRSIPFKPKLELIDRLQCSLQIASDASLTDVLHAVLYIAIATPHGVTILNDLINNLFTDASSPNSTYEPDGLIFMFLRKTYVAFHSLSFESEARLSHDLRQFIHPQPENIEYTARTMHPTTSVVANIALDLASGPPRIRSAEGKIMAKDIQTCSSLLTSTSSEPSYTSQTSALHPLPHTPDSTATVTATAAQYVAHLEAIRRKDVSTAFDTLHRYFDRTLFFLPNTKPLSSSHSRTTSNNDSNTSTIEPHAHQYAGLALATAHAQLGNVGSATTALDDVLRAAHAADDRVCQSRVLAWKAQVEQDMPRRHLLLMHAGDPLALAHDLLHTVFTPISDSTPYASPLSLQSAFAINTTTGNIGRSCNGPGQADNIASAAVPTPVRAAAARRMRSVLPKLTPYGKNRVQQLLTAAAARFSDADASTALSNARLAARIASAESPSRVTMACVQAAIAVAMLTATAEGRAGEAEEILQSIRNEAEPSSKAIPDIAKNRNTQTSNHVEPVSGETMGDKGFTAQPEIDALDRALRWLKFERAERRSDVPTAEMLCQQINAMATVEGGTANTGEDPVDLTLDALEATVRLHILRHDAWRAIEAAHILRRQAAVAVRPIRTIEALRLCAQAHLVVGAGGHALHAILAAISLSEGLGVSRARVRCAITLAECLLSDTACGKDDCQNESNNDKMYASHRALRVIEDGLPLALEGLGVFGRAHARRVHAECHLALLSAAYHNGKRKSKLVGKAMTANVKWKIIEGEGEGNEEKEEKKEEGGEERKGNDEDVDSANACVPSQSVVEELLEAAKDYKQCEDVAGERRCWYLLARVHNWREESHQRNIAARKFIKLDAVLRYREVGLSQAKQNTQITVVEG